MGCDSLIRKPMMPLNHVQNGGWFGWAPGLWCSLFLLPALGCPAHGRGPYALLAHVLSQRRLFKHHPVPTIDFQERFCFPPTYCATLGHCSTVSAFRMVAGCCYSVTQMLSGTSWIYSLYYDPYSPTLGDSGWRVLILTGNENHILFRL